MVRILLVDDEESELKAWQKALKYAGYQAVTANSAAKAIEAAEEEPFDIVILDYIMPSMKGIQLLAKIRKSQPLVRSVLISGKLDETTSEEQLSLELNEAVEVDYYLHKPVSNQRLLEVIQTLTAKQVTDSNSWQKVAKKVVSSSRGAISKAKITSAKLDKLRKKK